VGFPTLEVFLSSYLCLEGFTTVNTHTRRGEGLSMDSANLYESNSLDSYSYKSNHSDSSNSYESNNMDSSNLYESHDFDNSNSYDSNDANSSNSYASHDFDSSNSYEHLNFDTSNSYKSLGQRRLGKFDKKVTWSSKLTAVKVITPQPSWFDNLTDIAFTEEEEEDEDKDEDSLISEEKEQFTWITTNNHDNISIANENNFKKKEDNIYLEKNQIEFCYDIHENSNHSSLVENEEKLPKTNYKNIEAERDSLDKSLQLIFGTNLSKLN